MTANIRCHILLFADLAEALRTRRIALELPADATVDDALAALAENHPAINQWRGRLAFALGDDYCTASTRLADGCEIALIPPVSGG